jgi:hypothetical protein
VIWLLIAFAIAVAIGVWRKFGPIQWIWLIFGTAITILVIWVLLLAFVIGPEMVRTGPPGGLQP